MRQRAARYFVFGFLATCGVHEYPNDDFFSKLAEEYFRRNRDPNSWLVWIRSAVAHQKPRFMMRRPKLCDRMRKDTLCLQAAQNLQKVDPDNARADYFYRKGGASGKVHFIAHFIKAPGYTKAFKVQRKCYEEAKPHLERFRKAAPDALRLWAPLLYDAFI